MHSIDSMNVIAHERSREQSAELVSRKYFGRERSQERKLERPTEKPKFESNTDTLFAHMTPQEQRRVVNTAIEKAKNMKDAIEYNGLLLDDSQRYIRKHEMELHRKFTLSFACLIFFFIGAPLGAIIRKGGLGAPVVISVVMFVIYYIIDNTGYKMAREDIWPVWAGLWLSSSVLLPIGIFLTYKAATDSALLNPDAWIKVWEKLKQWFMSVLMPRLESLLKQVSARIESRKLRQQ